MIGGRSFYLQQLNFDGIFIFQEFGVKTMRRPVQPHVVLEQELQALLQEDLDGSVDDLARKGDSGDDEAKTAIKKRVRVIKNRLAAKRSREQARTYVQQLESTLNALAAHNEFLARRLAAVEAENDTLKRGFSFHPQGTPEVIDQKGFRGEPAVLPLSSLQLDGLFLLSLLSVFLNPTSPNTTANLFKLEAQFPPQSTLSCHGVRRRRSGRSKRHLRRAGLLLCNNHCCRLKRRRQRPQSKLIAE